MDYRLCVDRGHLVLGLKQLQKTVRRGRRAGRAIVGFDGQYLSIEVGTIAFLAQATGAWPANAIVGDAMVPVAIDEDARLRNRSRGRTPPLPLP